MKYEFISRPWFAALHAIICEKARIASASDPELSFSICEVFTGVPPELAILPGGRAAWYAIVRGADVSFGLSERDDVAFKAVADYAAVLPLARYDTMGRTERATELQSMSASLAASGQLTAQGSSPGASGGAMATLHDSISRLTR